MKKIILSLLLMANLSAKTPYDTQILDYIKANYEWSFSGEPDFSAGFYVVEETLKSDVMDIHEGLASVVAEVTMEEWYDGPGWDFGKVSCDMQFLGDKLVEAKCKCEGYCEHDYQDGF